MENTQFEVLLDRAKRRYGFKFDKDLLEVLGITRQTLAGWKRQNDINRLAQSLDKLELIQNPSNKDLLQEIIELLRLTDESFLLDLKQRLLKKNYAITEPKLAIFAPLSEASQNYRTISTKFEKNKRQRNFKDSNGDTFFVRGNLLTQTHRDLIDCILLCSTRKPNNHFVFSFDDIKELWPSIQPEFLKNLLDELQTTVVERKIIGESVSIVSSLKSNPDIADIAINDRFYPFLEPKIGENKLALLLQTKSGLIKAIARYFILVENDIVGVSNIDVDTVFTAIGIAKNDKTEYLKILAEDASELSKFGIEFDQQTETFIKND